MSIDLTQFHQAFFEETHEHLAEIENQLLAMDLDAVEGEALNAIFRAAHSIKGSSAIFGFTAVADFTHHVESLLDKVRHQQLALSSTIVDLVLESVDCIRAMAEALRAGAEPDVAVAELVDRLHQASQAGQAASVSATAGAADDDSFGFFDDLVPAPTVQEDDSFGLFDSAPAPADPDDSFGLFDAEPKAASAAAPSIPTATAADEGFGFFDEPPAPAKAAAPVAPKPVKAPKEPAKAAAESNSIRVSVEKVDQLINLVGELVITQSMLLQTGKELDPVLYEKHLNSLTALERNTRDLQESVLSIRLLPVSYLFSRFPRVVRDLAGKLNKEVDLIVLGDQTELDKSIIERLSDPLAHLVRNSIDHGIEKAEDRVAKGKERRGQVILSAAHEAGAILIEISDDGNGLNRDRILAKARENGLPVHDQMPDSEVWNLIFAPGFSTAEAVTDVSGRGVGMDVVRRNIQELGGRIDIESRPGEGSTFSIRLPLTLAILDGMVVSVAGEVLVLPMDAVVESITPDRERVKEIVGKNRVIQMRGDYIPLLDCAQEYGLADAIHSDKPIAIVIESEGRRVALLVDELLGQQQVVIKNLERNYRPVAGISGATVMGDGSVALILDVAYLVRRSDS